MNPVQHVIHRTIENFPGYAPDDFRVTAVEKGGSDRKFWRIHTEDRSMILVKYTGQREENRHYVDIARFLAQSGVQVPQVFFHDPEEGLIWMQDLGEDDLWAHRDDAWESRRSLYESALIEVFKMHTAATRRLGAAPLRLERDFNEQLYLWEQGYFFEHCLANHFQLPAAEVRRISELQVLHDAAVRLAAKPRVLVHRDFQSQNVMVAQGTAWLIDFQGMRPGLAAYDLASLLYDPYVDFLPAEREELLGFYTRLARRSGVEIDASFSDTFHWCAVQRLMQALGAYGFLGLQKGRTDFLRHIPAARRNLREVAAKLDGMDEFVSLLDSLP